jgi:hypothetical protein
MKQQTKKKETKTISLLAMPMARDGRENKMPV